MFYLESFKVAGCDAIRLEFFKKMSDRKPAATAQITAPEEIGRILEIMSRLPEKGEVMIKMGNVPVLSACLLLRGEGIGHLEFYHEMLKMPDTSFCSDRSGEEIELYRLLAEKLRV